MSQLTTVTSSYSRKYFTIGEVSQMCAVKPHVLRYWEQEFPKLQPAKRRGNRRYYQYKDVEMIKQIYDLLYHKGFTINGARQWLDEQRATARKNQATTSIIGGIIREVQAALDTLEA